MKGILIQIILIIYSLIGKLLCLLASILPIGNKIRKWFTLHNEATNEAIYNDPSPLILFACSSVGEYKRIETLAQHYALLDYTIEISFFSPSGYSFINGERHNWSRISLLPMDQSKDVALFLKARKPSYVVVSSNMIWPNFIRGLDINQIRYSIVGCSYYPETFFQRLSLKFRLALISNVEYAFCIDHNTGAIVSKHLMPEQIMISGDPRLDSILKGHKSLKGISKITKFKGDNKLIVLGSAYTKEVSIMIKSMDLLKEYGYKVLIAPHELDHIKEIIAQFQSVNISFDLYSEEGVDNAILILDTMGVLKSAYGLAEIAFIGGGWNRGIHNIDEAMFHDCVIVSGPMYSKFPEARFLVQQNILTVIKMSEDLSFAISQEGSKTFTKKKIQCYEEWLGKNKHANQIIIDTLEINLKS